MSGPKAWVRRVAGLLAVLPLALAPPVAAQDAYPARAVRVVVPFAAGGGADLVARALSQRLSEQTGRQFVVDNRPGGAANIGTEVVAQAPADGYTLLVTGPSHIINAHLFRRLPFDPLKGFTPISLLTSAPYVLVADPALPLRNLGDLLAMARSRPGALSYGSAGNGTAGHLAMELIRAAAGIDMVHVPYRGSPAVLTDLMGGRIAVAFDNVLSSAPGIAAGRLRALAVSGDRRAPALPDVPTVAEAGLPGFDVKVWQGALFPAGVDPAIVTQLAAEMHKAMQAPELQARLQTLGVAPIGSDAPTFVRFLEAENTRWGEAVRRSGAQLD
ncbi:tripartite tricarboxylate transporter substrate binding protein [Falsiroseomonas selenitidurans]|uniref:tripartite tricarboxylate transporter substrate binding protein n=1 Tax=Falsiroseomonas selenitidurans TaxID=2716335 RepID=UPI00143A499B|nr:tripartite tricarboxylate transporter substrate binding protein [Falsiroseomonas selenitidurans]